MYKICIILLLLLPCFLNAQTYINKSKKKVWKQLVEYAIKKNIAGHSVLETDSTLQLSVPETAFQSTVFTFYFNKKNKCFAEKVLSQCDSCISKRFARLINMKKYNWRKINENQYVSDYSHKLMIESPAEQGQYYFIILKMNWDKKLYELLLTK